MQRHMPVGVNYKRVELNKVFFSNKAAFIELGN